MDEFYFQRSHVPAFGSWDCYDDLPFTQCFESARQAGIFRYSYSEDRDLYVAGDLYEKDVVTPAMIVVPRRAKKGGYPQEKAGGGGGEKEGCWAACECECEMKRAKSQNDDVSLAQSPAAQQRRQNAPKAVDEDLYKISPDLLHHNYAYSPKRKRAWGLFSSCLKPTCAY